MSYQIPWWQVLIALSANSPSVLWHQMMTMEHLSVLLVYPPLAAVHSFGIPLFRLCTNLFQLLVSLCEILNSFMFSIQTGPTIELVLDKSTVVIVDFDPYNSFSLSCTASTSSLSISATVTLKWKRNGFLLSSGGDTTITETDSDSITSKLSTKDTTVGEHIYTCEAAITLDTEVDIFLQSVTATVTINGKLWLWP